VKLEDHALRVRHVVRIAPRRSRVVTATVQLAPRRAGTCSYPLAGKALLMCELEHLRRGADSRYLGLPSSMLA
jgi:hypothetical protein